MWWNRFGPLFASDIRRQRVSAMRGFRHWRWHLDEVYVKLNGKMVYLWRAIDQEDEILESYVTKRRDKEAAMTELGNNEKREVGRWANNRIENSHLPFRRRERAMLRFRQMAGQTANPHSTHCGPSGLGEARYLCPKWSEKRSDLCSEHFRLF